MRALIVDDEMHALKLMSELLKEQGIDVAAAFQRPEEAASWLLKEKADVLFLDIEMPGINGITLANSLLEQNINIPVVFVTAYSEYAVEAFKLNALDYILKPVETERLKMTLKRIAAAKKDTPSSKHAYIKCFSRLQLVNSEGIAVHWRTAKAEELFAYLVDRGENGASRDKIMDELWNDFDSERALIHLNTTLYNIRKALAGIGISNALIYEKGMYRLLMDNMRCDAYEFKTAADLLSNGITHDNVQQYEEYLSMYTGAYLEENYYAWAYKKQMELQSAYIEMVIAVCRFLSANLMQRKCISLLRRALSFEPFSLELNRMLVDLYTRMSDMVSVKQHINKLQARLKSEFGQDPFIEDFIVKIRDCNL